jgi:hypothetical protein
MEPLAQTLEGSDRWVTAKSRLLSAFAVFVARFPTHTPGHAAATMLKMFKACLLLLLYKSNTAKPQSVEVREPLLHVLMKLSCCMTAGLDAVISVTDHLTPILNTDHFAHVLAELLAFWNDNTVLAACSCLLKFVCDNQTDSKSKTRVLSTLVLSVTKACKADKPIHPVFAVLPELLECQDTLKSRRFYYDLVKAGSSSLLRQNCGIATILLEACAEEIDPSARERAVFSLIAAVEQMQQSQCSTVMQAFVDTFTVVRSLLMESSIRSAITALKGM